MAGAAHSLLCQPHVSSGDASAQIVSHFSQEPAVLSLLTFKSSVCLSDASCLFVIDTPVSLADIFSQPVACLPNALLTLSFAELFHFAEACRIHNLFHGSCLWDCV